MQRMRRTTEGLGAVRGAMRVPAMPRMPVPRAAGLPVLATLALARMAVAVQTDADMVLTRTDAAGRVEGFRPCATTRGAKTRGRTRRTP